MYLICSRYTWTREIWTDFDWVDLSSNKFGDSAREQYIDMISFVFDFISFYSILFASL